MTTRGLGDNPLDRPRRRMPTIIPSQPDPNSAGADQPDPTPAEPAGAGSSGGPGDAAPAPARAARPSRKSIRAGRAQLTCYIDEAISEEARNAIMYLSNAPDGPVNLSDLVNQALHHEIGRLRTAHHAGKPFPPRRRPLRVGRPV